ncbi:efflux RND transporter periplasmic adaptor subunit [Haliea sp. E17]|uniref:efflux RND transporter periplasmic adaptor subunit n=1 Tax=Haliea sp. E17 TaxID=3401576 RepID=UPI003AB0BAD7
MVPIKRQLRISLLLLAAALAAASLMYMNRPPAQIAEPEQRAVSVDVAVAVAEDRQVEVQAQGTVQALRETTLVAEVPGRIVATSDKFHAGGFVAEGEVLVRIDPRDYQTALLRAEAALETAQSALIQEEGRAEVAQREWEKLPANSQRTQQARELYLRKPQLDQAKAQQRAATADLNTARDQLERTIIRAPYDAVIRDKQVDLGQYVVTGNQIAALFSVGVAEVRLPIPQSRLEFLNLPGVADDGANPVPVDLYASVAGALQHWPATVHRTEAVFDERSRVLYAVARVDDPYALRHPDRPPLRLGSFVNANIQGRVFSQVIALPRHVLRAGNRVWVVDRDDILRNRDISILNPGGDYVLVNSGLKPGERVSLSVLDDSLEGSKVTINSSVPTDELGGPAKAGLSPEATAGVTP